MHRGGEASLRDVDWTERRWDTNQAYSDSKLFITALAIALAKRWPKVAEQRGRSGLGADQDGRRRRPDDLEEGHLTQTWLAVSDEPAAKVSGAYWHHRQQRKPAADALDAGFQDRLIAKLAELTGVKLS